MVWRMNEGIAKAVCPGGVTFIVEKILGNIFRISLKK